MSYSDFDLKKARSDFGLTIVEREDLFSVIEEAEISDALSETLRQNVPLAFAIGTEKASSELIIINVFLKIKRKQNVSLFSGVEFTVDKEKGLNGFCDFIISRSPEQLFIDSPVIAVVEAKNERIMAGMGQCVAEMVAVSIFNEKEGTPLPRVYGAVTTGHAWKFLKLEGNTVYIDIEDYYIKNPGKIVGILTFMMVSH
uniref:Uncharacterized protein n=1 Tax=Candidatus Kentrum sp. LPFa TaxID=2126335 RepID=A0A450VMQ0_9GAMM|nr:MAG: hypothetical protein BECKLPF1236A_GA0070988_1000127 [Candidatus Kentron sp. LPFa]VFK22641.1 MAG: hypothetical protein BECKLPF1236C_GA0070990_1000124 [Candidatus Kentron sp. LPFa]